MMHKVGTIKEIWRYPVKGMGGERIASCALNELGLEGDRRWAMRDMTRDEIQSCKFRPQLLRCTARSQSGPMGAVAIEFPDGAIFEAGDAQADAHLSALVGHRSCLEPLTGEADTERFRRFHGADVSWLDELKATFDRERNEPLPDFDSLPPSVAEYVVMPGTFFLVAPVHMITTATLARLSHLQPDADWDARRFRANLIIDACPSEADYVEQGWIGKKLKAGRAHIRCTAATPRCGAITRAQRDFGADRDVLRTVVNQADQNAGIYGQMHTAGIINEGDEVWLL